MKFIVTPIVVICQNTEKSPGDMRRLAVTQSPANAGMKNSPEVY